MSSRPTAIEALAEDPAHSGLALDFDGVLSPIVEDPTLSAIPERVAATLAQLATGLGLLAVLSGRPVEFLADRVRVTGVRLLGSYGIEQISDGVREIDPEAKQWLGPVREASRTLHDALAASPGIRVEEKSVSVAVHWRQAPDRAAAAAEVRRVTARIAAGTGLRLEPGKLVEELRPPLDVNKGSAIRALLASEKLTTIAYAGDDLGDIPALLAVREAGGYALVVDHGSETDPRLLELADQTYDGTEGFAVWLEELADAIRGSGRPRPT
jgi:trehalose 6-phosphate phosphatase